MYVTLVHVRVTAEGVDAFLEATRINHVASTLERGNIRFDVLRSVEEPLRFILYEAYVDEVAARAHKEKAHYATWRDAVTDMMAEPRVGVRYDGLLPEPDAPS